MIIEEQVKILEDICPASKHHTSFREVRHAFFENIKTEIQAYLLGFFVADGNVEKRRKCFRITLTETDSEIIELYRNYICPNARIYRSKGHLVIGRSGQIYQQKDFIGIDIVSVQLVQSLVDNGYGYGKTYSELGLPDLPDDLMTHFIRGYFDGDGTFTSSYVPENPPRKERFRGHFMIDCKTNTMLTQILTFLAKKNISTNIIFLNRDLMYRISTGSREELLKLYKLLYKDSNFFLKRKHNKFNHYVNTEVTLLIAEYRNALKVSVNESDNPSKSAEHPILLDENVR